MGTIHCRPYSRTYRRRPRGRERNHSGSTRSGRSSRSSRRTRTGQPKAAPGRSKTSCPGRGRTGSRGHSSFCRDCRPCEPPCLRVERCRVQETGLVCVRQLGPQTSHHRELPFCRVLAVRGDTPPAASEEPPPRAVHSLNSSCARPHLLAGLSQAEGTEGCLCLKRG